MAGKLAKLGSTLRNVRSAPSMTVIVRSSDVDHAVNSMTVADTGNIGCIAFDRRKKQRERGREGESERRRENERDMNGGKNARSDQ